MNQLSAKLARALSFGTTFRRSLSSSAAAAPERVAFLRLNTLQDNPGAVHTKRRVGRGIGSSKGKTSGRGHKGQKARSGGNIHPTFEGGQTKFFKLVPKRGFNNKEHESTMVPLNIGTLQMYIDMGRIDPTKEEITLHDLQMAGLFKANAVKNGVKLLGDEKSCPLQQPIHLHVSRASKSAIDAVEKAGGTVTTVHYNQLALRAIMRPEKFDQAPRFARPPPKYQPYYTSWGARGYLNPQVQLRAWLRKNPAMKEKFESLLLAQKNEESSESS